MKLNITRSLVATGLVIGLAALAFGPAQAQTTGLTRAQVKMDRDTFLAMARWDPLTETWMLKEDVAMPEGIKPRSEVKAERDKFLSMNTWNNAKSEWLPMQGAPREMSKLTRAEVKAELAQFMKTHRYDEISSSWVSKTK